MYKLSSFLQKYSFNRNPKRFCRRLVLSTLPALMVITTPVSAYHGGETLKLDFGFFKIHGSYSKKACSAQANLPSDGGKSAGFAIYWRPGKGLHLLVSHPDNVNLSGKQKIKFVFADGKKVVFPMTGDGVQLQVPVGIGPRALSFYDAVQNNETVRIEMPGVNDSVLVNLSRRDEVEQGMATCSDWLH